MILNQEWMVNMLAIPNTVPVLAVGNNLSPIPAENAC